MNRITASLSVAAAGLIAAGGLLVASGPAMATSCSGASSCQESGTVTVTAGISETLSASSFSFGGGSPISAGNTVGPEEPGGSPLSCATAAWLMSTPVGAGDSICPDLSVVVTTGDGAGYLVQSYATDLAAGAKSIPASAMKVALVMHPTTGSQTGADWTSNAKSETNSSASPVTLVTKGGASNPSGDTLDQFDSLAIPGSAGNGTYSTTINMIAIAS